MIRLFALLCLEVFFECERLLETQLEKIGVRGVLGFLGLLRKLFWFGLFFLLSCFCMLKSLLRLLLGNMVIVMFV